MTVAVKSTVWPKTLVGDEDESESEVATAATVWTAGLETLAPYVALPPKLAVTL